MLGPGSVVGWVTGAAGVGWDVGAEGIVAVVSGAGVGSGAGVVAVVSGVGAEVAVAAGGSVLVQAVMAVAERIRMRVSVQMLLRRFGMVRELPEPKASGMTLTIVVIVLMPSNVRINVRINPAPNMSPVWRFRVPGGGLAARRVLARRIP